MVSIKAVGGSLRNVSSGVIMGDICQISKPPDSVYTNFTTYIVFDKAGILFVSKTYTFCTVIDVNRDAPLTLIADFYHLII